MKSLILTALYLFKDTLYRWKERPSSPLSRILVVFFLSICALSVLATYIISTRTIRDEIQRNGGDMVIVSDLEDTSSPGKTRLLKEYLPQLGVANLVMIRDVTSGVVNGRKMSVVAYNDESLSGLTDLPLAEFPYLALLPRDEGMPQTPASLDIEGYCIPLVVREMPPGHLLEHVYRKGVILIPESAIDANSASGMIHRTFLIRVKDMNYANLKLVEETINNIGRLDDTMTHARSSALILSKLEALLDNQMECRAGFAIGIAIIVGILLTALASMEFRQNEYVYTLMKSFGVQPSMLVLTFIGENLFLVLGAFAVSTEVFIRVQRMILGEFFKGANLHLSLQDLSHEIIILAGSLVICVLFSSIPIVVSAYREIGRVLK